MKYSVALNEDDIKTALCDYIHRRDGVTVIGAHLTIVPPYQSADPRESNTSGSVSAIIEYERPLSYEGNNGPAPTGVKPLSSIAPPKFVSK